MPGLKRTSAAMVLVFQLERGCFSPARFSTAGRFFPPVSFRRWREEAGKKGAARQFAGLSSPGATMWQYSIFNTISAVFLLSFDYFIQHFFS